MASATPVLATSIPDAAIVSRGGRHTRRKGRAYDKTCYNHGMTTLTVRTDAAMEKALRDLAAKHGSRTDAVRYALMRTYRETLLEQASDDAERLASDEDDRAEMLAIQRYMGTAE